MQHRFTWQFTISIVAATLLGLWGCGGGGGVSEYHRDIPEGYTAVSFTAGGSTDAGVSHELASMNIGILKDAADSGTGTASSAGGPSSVYDSVGVTCLITTADSTANEAYTVTTNSSWCINQNECIVCTQTGVDTSACGLTCEGVVPSSAAAASDYFGVLVIFINRIATDMPDPYGTIRVDVSRTGSSFDLSSIYAYSFDECTYDPGFAHELELTDIAQGTWFTNTVSNYRRGFAIANVDPDAGNSNRTNCNIYLTFDAGALLTGADTPGTAVTNNLGTVTMTTKICDYEDPTPVSQDNSVCTE